MLEPGKLTTSWMQADQLGAYLEPGDLIEIRRVVGRAKRRIYTNRFRSRLQHWTVFIGIASGKVYVVHMATDNGDFKVGDSDQLSVSLNTFKYKARGIGVQVQRDELTKVARGDSCRINNSLDKFRRPFPPIIVVERALLMLGSMNYHILLNNCEHFANYCRYGTKQSEQATVAKSFIAGSTTLCVSGSLPLALFVYCLTYTMDRFGHEIKKYLPPNPHFSSDI